MDEFTHTVVERVFYELAATGKKRTPIRRVDLAEFKAAIEKEYLAWAEEIVIGRGYAIARLIERECQVREISEESLFDFSWWLMTTYLWPNEYYTVGPERSYLDLEVWLGQAVSVFIHLVLVDAGTFPQLVATDSELQSFLDARNPFEQKSLW